MQEATAYTLCKPSGHERVKLSSRRSTAFLTTKISQAKILQVEFPGELPVCWGDFQPLKIRS